MFTSLLSSTQAALAAGQLDLARQLLDKAWAHASEPKQRKLAHDTGNAIQRAIFESYLAN